MENPQYPCAEVVRGRGEAQQQETLKVHEIHNQHVAEQHLVRKAVREEASEHNEEVDGDGAREDHQAEHDTCAAAQWSRAIGEVHDIEDILRQDAPATVRRPPARP